MLNFYFGPCPTENYSGRAICDSPPTPSCSYINVFFLLTTATQPRAGMLSLIADRWLKKLLPRFRSRKLWISWM